MALATNKHARAFGYRAGVRLQGTIVACDASTGSDLIFLSHARALDARAAGALPRGRAGKRQVLTTATTLALLGAAGERLRPSALLAPYGRPFALGTLRLELFPSGHLPGAASLLCDNDGRRTVYSGPLDPEAPPAYGPPEARPADALCLDATFGAGRFVFPPRGEALAAVTSFAAGAAAAGRAPVVLFDDAPVGLQVAEALVAAGLAPRAHRALIAAAALFRRAGLAAPVLQRWDGRLAAAEVLLWPREGRDAPRLGALHAPAVLLASGLACDPASVAAARADAAVPVAAHADFQALLRYALATGAREVALMNAPGDDLFQALRERGITAYPIGPPRQIALFAAADAA